MNSDGSHEAIRNMFAEGKVATLTGADWERLRVHLADCETCTDDLAELNPALLLASPITHGESMDAHRSQQLRAQLLARAASEGHAAGKAGSPSGAAAGRRFQRRGWMGWAVAAGMSALLLTHHAFHQPLNFGWLAAAMLGILFAGVSIYATLQRDRVSALHERLAIAERERQQLLDEMEQRGQRPVG